VVPLDFGINEFEPVRLEGGERAFLVRAYEA
jgi:hypothetical protein